jgi:citrate lyase subunit beta/citryl-CoA lyase
MWSIHPSQIPVIVEAFTPADHEVESALDILAAGMAADWAPVAHRSQGIERLHDRASYRYYWHVLERAHRVGVRLPFEAVERYFG